MSVSECELLSTVKCRKITYLGHVLRGRKYNTLQLILKGIIEEPSKGKKITDVMDAEQQRIDRHRND